MRVVVIGAGVGGLAAAARLAATGHQVTVVERADRPGGKLAGYRRDGYVFDTGPALLTLPGVFEELFRATGDPLASCLDVRRLDPAVRYRFPAGDGLDLPGLGAESVLTTMSGTLGGRVADEWATLLADWERLWPVLRDDVLGRELGMGGLARLLLRRPAELRRVAPWRSLAAHSRRRLSDDRLRAILDRYASYAGSEPGRAPAVLGVIAYVEQALGCWHVAGGVHRLAEALATRVGERGGRIRCGLPAESVELAGSRVAGVRLSDGGRLPADLVVSDVDAWQLYEGLLGVRQRLPRGTPSLSAFSVLLATDGPGPAPPHHLVAFPADYGAEYREVFAGRPASDPAIHVCVPDDPAMHPPDGRGWSVLVNAPRHDRSGRPGTMDWTAPGAADRYADRLLALLAARGVEVPPVRWRVVRTPADIERESAAPGGSIYGSAARRPAAAFLRPRNRSPVPGLFLVGGSAHPGGGLPLVALSARIVAGMVGAP